MAIKKETKSRFKQLLTKINLAYLICDHLIGKNHQIYHRLVVGTCIILLGIGILSIKVTFPALFVTHTANVICDGLGVVPWLELILNQEKNINL